MRYLFHIILTSAFVHFTTSCYNSETVIEGNRLTHKVTRVGGKVSKAGAVVWNPQTGTYVVTNDDWDGTESLRDVTRMTNSLGLGWMYATIQKAQAAANVAMAKSANKVDATAITEGARTDRVIDTNATKVKLFEAAE